MYEAYKMQKIKCPACLGTKEYPYAGNRCIRCDGRGYIDFGEAEQNTINRIMNVRKEANAYVKTNQIASTY
jgi:hypothetical protein